MNVIIVDDDDMEVDDTLSNIEYELSGMGYAIDETSHMAQAPRGYETGQTFLVYNKNNKVVALYELCSGYYEHANINIYTGDEIGEIVYDDVTKNKRDIERVVRAIKLYTTQYHTVKRFSNGETFYEEVK